MTHTYLKHVPPEPRRWQDERDDDIEAPDTYPEPEPDHLYTPNQA